MNEKKSNSSSRISENSPVVLKRDASVSTNRSQTVEDVETSTQTTYASTFFWILFYVKMFFTRLGRDLFQSAKCYVFPDNALPAHIADLLKVQSELYKERETSPATYCRYNDAFRRPSNKSSAAHSIQSISLVPDQSVRCPALRTH